MSEERLTRAERGDLQRIARMRARNSRAQLDTRRAELLADLEVELASKYPINDPRWAEFTEEAKKAVDAADRLIEAKCAELGIRPEFRPGLGLQWYERGENGSSKRRSELRTLGQAKLDAAAKTAKLEIDRVEMETCTAILADGLRSADAQEYLARIPEPKQLMQPLSLDDVETDRLERAAARELQQRAYALGRGIG